MATANFIPNFSASLTIEDSKTRHALVQIEHELKKIATAINANKDAVDNLGDTYYTEAEMDTFLSKKPSWLSASFRCIDLTSNNSATTWTDEDITGGMGELPTDAIVAILQISVQDGTAGRYVQVRKNGDTPTYVPTVWTQVASVYNTIVTPVGLDSSGIFEWQASDANLTRIVIDVLGWY